MTITSERFALVIGNNAYQSAPLRNPVNDAQDMSQMLSELGFKVILKENVDRRSMEDAIRSFGRQLRNGGVGLFYFAGHGIQVEGRNYLIPINAKIESEADIKYEAVDAGLVLGKMEDAKNQLNIVILDACRNNPFARSFRSSEQGLAKMDAPRGALVAYATAPGDVAADGPERNGVFTKHLIRHMQTPNVPVEQVLKRVRIDVATETTQRQIPWESSSLMGDFYFRIEKSQATPGSLPSGALATSPKEPMAAIPKSETVASAVSAIKPSLAIFPIYFSGRGSIQSTASYDQIKTTTVESLKRLMENNKNYSSLYSYYELPKGTEYSKIPSDILNEKIADDLWVSESFFSKKKPNIPLIIKLGKKLDVVNVLLIEYGEILNLYIFDVNQGKVFFKDCHFNPASSYSEIPRQMKEFLKTYEDYLIR